MKLEEWMNYQIGQISVGKILSALLLLCVCLAVAKLLMKLVDRMILRLKVEKSLHHLSVPPQNSAFCF